MSEGENVCVCVSDRVREGGRECVYERWNSRGRMLLVQNSRESRGRKSISDVTMQGEKEKKGGVS
jgi:hypothetical protein